MEIRTTRVLRSSLALVLLAASPSGHQQVAAAAPPITLATCAVGITVPVSSTATLRPVVQLKHFEKQGMTFSANSTVDGAIQVDARGGEFGFRKKVFQDGRFIVELDAPGDTVSLTYVDGVAVTRGQKTVTLSAQSTEADLDQARRLLADSRAVRLMRAKGAEFEAADDDSAAAASLLLVDGLVGALTGDVGAPRRVARLLSKKARASLRAAADRPETCYSRWESSILWAYINYEDCAFLYFYPWWMCSLRWNMESESAWFSFISCMGFGF